MEAIFNVLTVFREYSRKVVTAGMSVISLCVVLLEFV